MMMNMVMTATIMMLVDAADAFDNDGVDFGNHDGWR